MAGLTISVIADVAKAIKGLDQVSEKAGGFSKGLQGVAGAVGGVLSFGAAEKWASSWIDAAKKSNKATKGVGIVFGQSAGIITDFATTSANALGMTQTEAERYAITIGNQLEGYGVSQKEAAKGSVELTKRASDMAYVLGTDVSTVLSAMGSALKGRTAGLKSLGVNIDSNTVKDRLAAKGLGELTGEQATAAQASEILAMMLEQTSDKAGVLSSKTDETATSLPALNASIEDTKASLGQALLPILNTILPVLNDFAQWAEKHPGLMQAVAIAVLAVAVAVGVFSIAMTALSIAGAPVWAIVIGIGIAIAALIAVVILCITHWSTLVGWFKTAWDWISRLIDKVWGLLAPIASGVWATFSAIWGGIVGFFRDAVGFIQSVWSKISDLATLFGKSVWASFSAIWDGIKSAIDGVKKAAEAAWNVIEKIKNAPANIWHAITPFSLPGAGAAYAPSGPWRDRGELGALRRGEHRRRRRRPRSTRPASGGRARRLHERQRPAPARRARERLGIAGDRPCLRSSLSTRRGRGSESSSGSGSGGP
jgi:Flp pilus assembly pilin Flp